MQFSITAFSESRKNDELSISVACFRATAAVGRASLQLCTKITAKLRPPANRSFMRRDLLKGELERTRRELRPPSSSSFRRRRTVMTISLTVRETNAKENLLARRRGDNEAANKRTRAPEDKNLFIHRTRDGKSYKHSLGFSGNIWEDLSLFPCFFIYLMTHSCESRWCWLPVVVVHTGKRRSMYEPADVCVYKSALFLSLIQTRMHAPVNRSRKNLFPWNCVYLSARYRLDQKIVIRPWITKDRHTYIETMNFI